MSRRKLIPVIVIILLFSCFKTTQGLKQSDIPSLIRQFLLMHVHYHRFNDEISKRTFNNFLYILDYGKQYFHQSDIDSFKQYKTKIDDNIRSGNYSFIFKIFVVYKNRFEENMKLFDTLLKRKYNFKINEHMLVDRDKIKYVKNKKEMKDRWRKNIKLQLLNYISAGKSMSYARNKLKKRYQLVKRRVNEIDQAKLLSKFMNAFSTALDPHSNYLTQNEHEDFMISMRLKFEGIGARLRSEDGFVIVDAIIPGGAADKLAKGRRLLPNDKIIEVAQGSKEPIDVIDMDLRDVVKKIRGKKGTEVRLTVLREMTGANKPKRIIVSIIREEIKLQDKDADAKVFINTLKGKKVKIGYIKLPSFYYDRETGKSSTTDLKKHLKKLKKAGVKGIILDLRGNPGGSLRQAIRIGGLFIKKGPILQVKSTAGSPRSYNDNDGGVEYYTGPLIVLIDKFSASASEIVSGAIRDYKRGIVIGPGSSFGKGTVQQYQPLPYKKGAIKITTSVFYQPGGTSNQLNGISPHLLVPDISLFWDIGEKKTRYPLKWKKIPSTQFNKYTLVNGSLIFRLKRASQSRINRNKKFIKLLKDIKKFQLKRKNRTISLKDESDFVKKKKKDLKKKRKKRGKNTLIDKDDIFLREAFNITQDYIQFLGK